MKNKIILIIASLLSCLYCLRFGYILTGYVHGGQLLGIPFALVMITLSVIYCFTRPSRFNKKIFSGALIYFSSLAVFSLIVEVIIKNRSNYFDLLYLDSTGKVGTILMSCLAAGIVAMVIVFRKINAT